MLHSQEQWHCLLVISGVGEPNKRQVVSSECLWRGEILLWTLVLLDVIEVTRILVAAELGHHWWHAISDRVKRPLIVFEELVFLDLIDSISPKSHISVGEEAAN